MKKVRAIAVAVVLIAAGFLSGTWLSWATRDRGGPAERKILYWVDPMHPSYKSDKPGIAPDCGMQLEPVYADDASALSGSGVPPGTLKVTPARQQVIGIRTGVVESSALRRTVRTVGKVVADENRVYRLVTSTEGWVRQVYAGQTGGVVTKGQLLLTFYSKEALTAQQTYFYTLNALDRFRATKGEAASQIDLTEIQVRAASEALETLGMSPQQIAELAKTRRAVSDIEVRSPVTGYIASRNVYPLQRFDRSTELYQIIDVSHVWVLADLFESDAGLVKPGMIATVLLPYQGESIGARVDNTLPQFDVATRTLKLRLEADNRAFLLRPEMLVDVELQVDLPEAMTVPADAVVDSGTRRVVFVDRGNGYFEPRRVQTGWRYNDRVQILQGLMEHERIVLSGSFLLDSESRMKTAAMGIANPETDVICGMEVDQTKARIAGRVSAYRGATYFFCSDACKKRFDANPAQYVTPAVPDSPRMASRAPGDGGSAPPYRSVLHAPTPAPPLPTTGRMGGSRLPWVPSPDRPATPDAMADAQQKEPDIDLSQLKPEPESKTSVDPVCGITVDERFAAEAGLTMEYQGTTYYFAAAEYKDTFQKDPARYARAAKPAEPMHAAGATSPQPTLPTLPRETPAAAAAPALNAEATDPVCGMKVDPKAATAAGFKSDYKGKAYYFCSRDCKTKFDKEPDKYVRQ